MYQYQSPDQPRASYAELVRSREQDRVAHRLAVQASRRSAIPAASLPSRRSFVQLFTNVAAAGPR
ncbi:MAG TPA: hypothetical protein VFH20_14135 [Propionibacteriaceae bacterium]|nr:hypothetical protein [Propionibacteriaceae bacterium]